jgi:hypothetical protein
VTVGPVSAAGVDWARRWERVSPRRRRILAFLAFHGVGRTAEVGLVAGVTRLTAHRDLTWLHRAGLVERLRSEQDSTHGWWYDITDDGVRVVVGEIRASGGVPPPGLGLREPSAGHHLVFLPLVAYAAAHRGECELLGWLGGVDTALWLRPYGLTHLHPDASGVWVERDRAVRFLVGVDRGAGIWAPAEQQSVAGLDRLVEPYQRDGLVVPVSVVLFVLTTVEREQELLSVLDRDPLPVPAAATSVPLLKVRSPADASWQVPGQPYRRRLIDVAAR